MFAFPRRPRWIGLTLFAVVVVAVCVRLGLWQLDRLEGRREVNDRYAAGLAMPPRPLEDLLLEPLTLARSTAAHAVPSGYGSSSLLWTTSSRRNGIIAARPSTAPR